MLEVEDLLMENLFISIEEVKDPAKLDDHTYASIAILNYFDMLDINPKVISDLFQMK